MLSQIIFVTSFQKQDKEQLKIQINVLYKQKLVSNSLHGWKLYYDVVCLKLWILYCYSLVSTSDWVCPPAGVWQGAQMCMSLVSI